MQDFVQNAQQCTTITLYLTHPINVWITTQETQRPRPTPCLFVQSLSKKGLELADTNGELTPTRRHLPV